MKSGILATTTLLVVLGTVEQVQAQTETDRGRESDVTEFSPLPDYVSAGAAIAREKDEASLAWQTDFGAKSPTIAPPKELGSLSPVAEPEVPLLANFPYEPTENRPTSWSNQFRPRVPLRNVTPAPRREDSFLDRENSERKSRSGVATTNYSDENSPESESKTDRPGKVGTNSPITTSTALQQVTPLSTYSVGEPEIPPLAAATIYLPEAQEERPVFNGYGWPAQGVITSGYGWRWGRMHNGIDIAGPIGTPIVAAADGVTIASEWNSGGYGNLVEIEHPDGSSTVYAHNAENRVYVGQVVKKGQLIALMGSTGYSTGPHLHFEVRLPGQGAVNPITYLPSGNPVARQNW